MSQFFWLICGLVWGLGNAVFVWSSLRKHVASGEFAAEDAKRLAVGIAVWIGVPCLLLWLLQMTMSSETVPFYWTWPNPQWTAALLLQALLWAVLLYWVFLGTGAHTLSRYLAVTGRPRLLQHPGVIRLVALAAVAMGVASLLKPHA